MVAFSLQTSVSARSLKPLLVGCRSPSLRSVSMPAWQRPRQRTWPATLRWTLWNQAKAALSDDDQPILGRSSGGLALLPPDHRIDDEMVEVQRLVCDHRDQNSVGAP